MCLRFSRSRTRSWCWIPWCRYGGGNENDTEEAIRCKWALDKIQNRCPGTLLVVLHHLSRAGAKNETGGKVYGSRGSTVFPGWTDAQYEIRDFTQTAGGVRFAAEPTKMRGIPLPDLSHISITFNGEVSWSSENDAKTEQKKTEIIDFLGLGPASKTKIAENINGRRQDTARMVDDLVEEGRVVREGGPAENVYRLPTAQDPAPTPSQANGKGEPRRPPVPPYGGGPGAARPVRTGSDGVGRGNKRDWHEPREPGEDD